MVRWLLVRIKIFFGMVMIGGFEKELGSGYGWVGLFILIYCLEFRIEFLKNYVFGSCSFGGGFG